MLVKVISEVCGSSILIEFTDSTMIVLENHKYYDSVGEAKYRISYILETVMAEYLNLFASFHG